MIWVDILGWLSWIVAYGLVVFATQQYGKATWRHIVPFVGLPVGIGAYLAVAWLFGRWPVLIVGLAMAAIVVVVVLRLSKQRKRLPGNSALVQ